MRLAAVVICSMLISVVALGQDIPQKISYQGKLFKNGSPVNGTKSITFTIGSWSETHSSVQITDGLYSVTLGENQPIPISLFNNNSNVKLKIEVENNPLYPQTEMLSVPYAYKAEKAKEAENTFSGDYNDLSNTPVFSGWDKNVSDDLSWPLSYSKSLNSDLIKLKATGSSAYELIELSTSTSYKGNALEINNNGSGMAIDINNSNNDYAIQVEYGGTSNIARFNINNSKADGFWINSNTKYNAFYIKEKYSGYNTYPTLWVKGNGSNYALYVKGDFTVTGSKNFAHKHPKDPSKQIVYSAKEGPEVGTYFRDKGKLKNGKAVIKLPKHFQYVTSTEDLTVQVTPAGNCNGLYVEEVSKEKLVVKELKGGNSNVEFYYQVNGVRKGFENKKVIRPKAQSQGSNE